MLNRVVMRDGKVCSPRAMREFEWESGAAGAVAALKSRGFCLIVATNQPDVARKKIRPQTLEAMTAKVRATLPVDGVCVCPHDDMDGCGCRKPKPGLLLDAARKWGLDCRRSFMIGDGWKDMAAGSSAGCRTILLDRAYNRDVACDFRVPGLAEAVELILQLEQRDMKNGGG